MRAGALIAGFFLAAIACGQDKPASAPQTAEPAVVDAGPRDASGARASDAGDPPLRTADGGALRTPHLVDTRIRILQRVFFTRGSAKLAGPSYALLNEIALALQSHPEITGLRIEGHASKGEPAPEKLSLARANAVLDYLATRGVARTMLTPIGQGDAMPLEADTSEPALQKNRRVELVVWPEVVSP